MKFSSRATSKIQEVGEHKLKCQNFFCEGKTSCLFQIFLTDIYFKFTVLFPKMSGGHKHRYKNVGLSVDELRRRREEEGVQLRKQKREQQLFKRRNVNLPAPDAPDIAQQVINLLTVYG